MIKKALILAIALVCFTLIACGSGGSGGDDGGSDGGGSSDTLTSLQLSLQEGAFWTFIWNTSTLTFAQPNSTN